VNEAGEYWVKVTSCSQVYFDTIMIRDTCIISDSVVIPDSTVIPVILPDQSYSLVLPNVFTPDHDGQNDQFTPIVTEGISSMHTQIFNRWGQLVFETDDPGILWDGFVKEKESNDGIYFWLVTFSNVNNHPSALRGFVQLIR
jgi:gliding motility-associated-like protein